jgi:hypothetical protein
MAMIHLIYVSSARSELGAEELARVLESSVRHNTSQHVTGFLLYLNGSFIQVLEGEKTVVDETYSRIQQDPRHTGLILIDRSPITARSFSRWSMGFKPLKATDLADHPAYAPVIRDGLIVASIGAKKGLTLDMLKQFALNQRG